MEKPEQSATNVGRPFRMRIDGIQEIPGRGTLVSGRIEQGMIKRNETVNILDTSSSARFTAVVSAIEMSGKLQEQAKAGDKVGLLLKGISSQAIKVAMLVSKPET
jgi:elongation factor Tu